MANAMIGPERSSFWQSVSGLQALLGVLTVLGSFIAAIFTGYNIVHTEFYRVAALESQLREVNKVLFIGPNPNAVPRRVHFSGNAIESRCPDGEVMRGIHIDFPPAKTGLEGAIDCIWLRPHSPEAPAKNS